jgi:cysteine-rich repeat protein
MRSLTATLFVSAGLFLAFACGDDKAADDKICAPNQYFFCRCRDRQEGTKMCKGDGKSFGPCEPCETADNPEGPLEPDDPGPDKPVTPKDAGKDQDAEPPPEPVCGDKIVQEGEDCDDKNDNDTDGCDKNCKLAGETPPSSNACGGLFVNVWGGDQKPTIVVSTALGEPANHTLATECNGSKSSTAKDRVFQVIPHKNGKMTVTSTEADFDTLLYVGTSCNPTTINALACANAKTGTEGETLTFDVQAEKKYFVFLDGSTDTGNTGKARITFSIP